MSVNNTNLLNMYICTYMNSDHTTKCNYRRTYVKTLDEGDLIKQSSYDEITLTANGFKMKL
jgi:hypothetical protein